MSKSVKEYEKNEYVIGKSLMEYTGFSENEYKINPTINPYEDFDLIIFNPNNKLSHIEIKCRHKQKIGYMIEYKKLNDFLHIIQDNKEQCRYVNYIENDDTLLIFNINKRIKNCLKNVYENLGGLFKYDGFRRGAFQKNTYQNDIKDKYYLDLFYNPEYGDTVIFNYSEKLIEKNIEFNYQKVN